MKKFTHIIITLSFCCFSFLSCDKDPFTKIELHGRVVNYMTKAPLQASISLSSGEMPGSKGNTAFGGTSTNSNGGFDVKSEGGWNSNDYYLVISERGTSNSVQLKYQVSNKQNVDAGEVLMGSYTFYCKVTINPIDNSAIDFVNLGAANHHYNAGTSTHFLCHVTYDFDEYFNIFGKSFPIAYKIYPGGVEKDTGISVPALTADTLSVTINY